LGELATDARQFAEAEKLLRTALSLADACVVPFERALTLLALAELQATKGHRVEAEALLEDVRIVCTALGTKPTLARMNALAERLATREDAPPTYPAGLSVREVEVLRLLATGRTNPEIADTLFISPATVRHHVAHILAKTNSDNRAAAAAFAQRHGLS
jgi:DNA-binding NarL/FixJ family response regulator